MNHKFLVAVKIIGAPLMGPRKTTYRDDSYGHQKRRWIVATIAEITNVTAMRMIILQIPSTKREMQRIKGKCCDQT